MLGPGDPVPDVEVWTEPGQSPERLRAILGPGLTLLCFYPFDWSPT
jgi:peroxiredoxin